MKELNFREISGQVDPNVNSTNRLLRKDVGSANRFPGEVTIGAQKKGIIQVVFFANGSAGNYSASTPLTLGDTPLSSVWFMGTIDKDGVVSQGGGMVPGSAFSSGTVLSGMEIFSGAIANYCCTATALTVKVTSTNVGWPSFIIGFFYYSTYYDQLGLPSAL